MDGSGGGGGGLGAHEPWKQNQGEENKTEMASRRRRCEGARGGGAARAPRAIGHTLARNSSSMSSGRRELPPPPPTGSIPPPPGLGGSDPFLATPTQTAELKKFLAWKEPTMPEDRAEVLTRMHKVEDLAVGLRDRYGILPQGWRFLVDSENTSTKAFNKNMAARGSALSDDSPVSTPKSEVSRADHGINEILDSETRFLLLLKTLQKRYLDVLYDIFGNQTTKDDKAAIKALGLTQEDCNKVFEQLPAIIRFSEGLLAKLDVINLVRKQPLSGEGRAIHVGQAFIDMAPKLHVYSPAILSYQSSLAVLEEAAAACKSKASSSSGGSRNFLELWDYVTSKDEVLKGQQLQAVLISPMQRIPRYKLLLEQLLKECDNVDAVPVVTEALRLFSSAAKGMNEAMRKHEKLANFFGAGADLKPMTTAGSAKDGEVKIANTYVHSKLHG